MNPFLYYQKSEPIIRINGVPLNASGAINFNLSSLPDVEFGDIVTNQQVLSYSETLKRWINNTLSLIGLSDIQFSSPLCVGQVLLYNGSKWVNSLISLVTLSDIQFSPLGVGQFLIYNGSKWINQTINLITSLAGLSDCSVYGPSENQILQFKSSKWTNQTVN